MRICKSSPRELEIEWSLLILGSVIYAVSTLWIQNVNVIPGSMLGIAVAVQKITGFPSGTLNLLLNIPIMLIVTRKMGTKVLVYTVFILVCSGTLINAWSASFPMLPIHNVYALAVIGGVTMGIGAGLLLVAKGTMAGTTALTLLITRVVRRPSYGTILFLMDSCIVVIGSVMVGDWHAILYSVMYAFFCAKTIDVVVGLREKVQLKPVKASE